MTLGCYTFHPVTASGTSVGEYVRVELTDIGAETVKAGVGSGALWLEGDVRATNNGGLTIALRTVSRREFGESSWNGETVALGMTDIRSMSARVLSRSRTYASASIAAAIGIGLIYWLAHSSGQASGSTGPPSVTPP